MRKTIYGLLFVLFAISVASYAFTVPYQQSDRTRQNAARRTTANDSTARRDSSAMQVKAQPVVVLEEDSIPDSLLHPRWKIQRITPITQKDLDTYPADLTMPDAYIRTRSVSSWRKEIPIIGKRPCVFLLLA